LSKSSVPIFQFAVKPGVLRFGPQNDGTAAAPTQPAGLLPAAGDTFTHA